MKEVFIVWWRFYDKSGSAFVGAFEKEDEANVIRDLLKAHSDGREYLIEAVPMLHAWSEV